MAVAPLSERFLPAAAWTGVEMLVWGGAGCQGACSGQGIRAHADGAAYDPSTDTWRSLPPSPLSARAGALAVWTGRELIVWGGVAGERFVADGAAFDPASNRWRSLPPSPLAGQFGAPPGTVFQVPGVWTGKEMLVWGQGAGVESPDADLPTGAAYDPAADQWRLLGPAPVAPRIAVPVWTGQEMVVWGGQSGSHYFDDGAAYDPAADQWRGLAASPLAARFTFAVWSGGQMLVWGGESSERAFDDGAAYEPAVDRWRPIPRSPMAERRGFAQIWTGDEMVVWGGAPGRGAGLLGTGAAYDPATGRWREIDAWSARLLPVAIWTGHEAIVWGGIGTTETGLLASSAEGRRLCLKEPCPKP
ncbi:MAG: Kelch repeat-containing protein [Acidimicrobiales bacterium]